MHEHNQKSGKIEYNLQTHGMFYVLSRIVVSIVIWGIFRGNNYQLSTLNLCGKLKIASPYLLLGIQELLYQIQKANWLNTKGQEWSLF